MALPAPYVPQRGSRVPLTETSYNNPDMYAKSRIGEKGWAPDGRARCFVVSAQKEGLVQQRKTNSTDSLSVALRSLLLFVE